MQYPDVMLCAFREEYEKIAAEVPAATTPELAKHIADRLRAVEKPEKVAGLMNTMKSGLRQAGEHLHHHEDAYELGGLGVLGAIGGDRLQAHARAHAAGAYGEQAIEKKQLLGGETGHAALDTAGLGLLAAPLAAKKLLGR